MGFFDFGKSSTSTVSIFDLTQQARDVMIREGIVNYVLYRSSKRISEVYLEGTIENVLGVRSYISEELGENQAFRARLINSSSDDVWKVDVDKLIRSYSFGILNSSNWKRLGYR